VLRLVPTFNSAAEAARYATRQALEWIGALTAPRPVPSSSSSTHED